MKKIVIVLLSTVLFGCGTTTTKPMINRDGSFTIMGESEFSYVEMVNDVHTKATRDCSLRGEQMEPLDSSSGGGGMGAFGSKQTFQLNYTCK